MALRLSFAALALSLSSTAFSAVTITAPEEIKVEGLNGQEVKSRLFSSNHNYSVQPGKNVLSVRYVQFFEEHPGIGSHDIVRSGIVHIKTPVLQDKATYRLGLVNPPKTHDDAKEFAKQPVFGLFDEKNQLLVQQAGAKDLNRGILQNLFSTSSTESAQAAPVSVTQPAAVYSPQAVVTTKPVATVSNVAGADQQLIQLWQQASKTERQKFMSWLAEQAN
ncbi:DUF2057 domain-containing protein [Acinetobacter indicus]|uniref:DUF2057 domain-containing protein n=1 Tax=Acinetobacter indicus TaxID=756892 RepID=UPI001362311F|nr:DUF2057 domain-containing protein [Acinetobacter indicus]